MLFYDRYATGVVAKTFNTPLEMLVYFWTTVWEPDCYHAFNTPLEMQQNASRIYCCIRRSLSILHWRCAVQACGTAAEGGVQLSILHWRCTRSRGRPHRRYMRLSFNTPLEMQTTRHSPIASVRFLFQYSIGDAACVCGVYASCQTASIFQYSIGDARYSAEAATCLKLWTGFQYSIGDACCL